MPVCSADSVERLVVDDGVRRADASEQLRAADLGRPPPSQIGPILLIDNGMRTGQTMAAAIRAVRTMSPGRIVAATPVGTASAVGAGRRAGRRVALPGDASDSRQRGNGVSTVRRSRRRSDPRSASIGCDRSSRRVCVLKVTAMDLAALTYETAKALEGTAFQIELPDGTVVPMKLDEVLLYETRQRRRPRGRMPRREPFSLYFLGPVSPILPQAMYTFRGETVTLREAVHRPRRSGRRRDGIRSGIYLSASDAVAALGRPLHQVVNAVRVDVPESEAIVEPSRGVEVLDVDGHRFRVAAASARISSISIRPMPRPRNSGSSAMSVIRMSSSPRSM